MIPEACPIVLPGLVEQDEEADKIKQDNQDGSSKGSCHCSMQNSSILPDWKLLVDLQEEDKQSGQAAPDWQLRLITIAGAISSSCLKHCAISIKSELVSEQGSVHTRHGWQRETGHFPAVENTTAGSITGL